MQRSEQINELIAALVKARAKFKPVLKDTDNPFYKSKYADLSSIIDATMPALNENGLVIIQCVDCTVESSTTVIETILAHQSGQFISSELHLPATQKDRFDPQSVGSSQTYGRRYAMQAILGVAAEMDDDGNAASNTASSAAAKGVADKKLAGVEEALYYRWEDASQTATIVGSAVLKEKHRALLAKLWSPVAGALVANAGQLEDLKYEFGELKVPFKPADPTANVKKAKNSA
jgi:hypothetical protein